ACASSWVWCARSGLRQELGRGEAVADRPDQIVRFGESHSPIHGENELSVNLDVVHAVIAWDQAKARHLWAELLQNRVRVLHRLRLISAGKTVPDQDLRHRLREWSRAIKRCAAL